LETKPVPFGVNPHSKAASALVVVGGARNRVLKGWCQPDKEQQNEEIFIFCKTMVSKS
jgi:hypothetical protein